MLWTSTCAVQAVHSRCNWHGIYVYVRERILERCNSPWYHRLYRGIYNLWWYLRPCYRLYLQRWKRPWDGQVGGATVARPTISMGQWRQNGTKSFDSGCIRRWGFHAWYLHARTEWLSVYTFFPHTQLAANCIFEGWSTKMEVSSESLNNARHNGWMNLQVSHGVILDEQYFNTVNKG